MIRKELGEREKGVIVIDKESFRSRLAGISWDRE
jgi:hypothetical protein